jgi:DNA-binding transcriptional regulator of glucitol operon
MSLKGFHVFFIAVCLIFCLALGVWGLAQHRQTGETMPRVLGIASLGLFVVLGAYGAWFLRKLRNFSFI